MRLVAIDPGKHYLGVACFRNGSLVYAGMPKVSKTLALPDAARELVRQTQTVCRAALGDPPWDMLACEYPQIYSTSRQKGNQNVSITPLVLVDGGLVIGIDTKAVELIEPMRWKGTINPDIVIERIKQKLSAEERNTVVLDNHNVWDSVGVGLWYLKRLHAQRG